MGHVGDDGFTGPTGPVGGSIAKFVYTNTTGSAGSILVSSGANNAAIFTQSSTQTIVNFEITYQNTSDTSTISVELVDMTGISYSDTAGGTSLVNFGILPNANAIIGTFTFTLVTPLTTTTSRPVGVRVTASDSNQVILNASIGFTN
jgi:hypothetical protein